MNLRGKEMVVTSVVAKEEMREKVIAWDLCAENMTQWCPQSNDKEPAPP